MADVRRSHADPHRLGQAVEDLGSSIVGGLAAGFGKVAANFVTGHLASKLIGNQLKFTLDRSGQGIRVEGAGFKTFYFVNNATWQGLGGVVAASADMAIQGGEFNWGTVTASAIPGAAEGTDRPYGLTGLIGNAVERIVLPQSVQVSNGPLNAPDTVYPTVAAGTGWETQPATRASGVEAPRAPSEPVYPPVSPRHRLGNPTRDPAVRRGFGAGFGGAGPRRETAASGYAESYSGTTLAGTPMTGTTAASTPAGGTPYAGSVAGGSDSSDASGRGGSSAAAGPRSPRRWPRPGTRPSHWRPRPACLPPPSRPCWRRRQVGPRPPCPWRRQPRSPMDWG